MRKVVVLIAAFGIGCSSPSEPEVVATVAEPVERWVPLDAQESEYGPEPVVTGRITDRAPRLDGAVPIVRYVGFGEEATDLRSFRAHLATLFDLGFRPATVSALLDEDFRVPPGSSPVVVAFYGADASVFAFQDEKLDPESALGVWATFAERHAGFPIRATLFVGEDQSISADDAARLHELGVEIGLLAGEDRIDQDALEARRDEFAELGFELRAIAVPDGARMPDASVRELIEAFLIDSETWVEDVFLADPYALPTIGPDSTGHKLDGELLQVSWGRIEPYVEP